MAELTPSTPHRLHRGVQRSKKLSTRVDLTPMVDLGFLLITFFIFTTTMTQPTAMRLILPNDSDPAHPQLEKNSAVLTLLLGKGNSIYCYEGADPTTGKSVDFDAVRSIILDKKRRTDPSWFEVILKPSSDCSYGNTVKILDEMTIDAVHHYALVDITPFEYKVFRSQPQKNSAP